MLRDEIGYKSVRETRGEPDQRTGEDTEHWLSRSLSWRLSWESYQLSYVKIRNNMNKPDRTWNALSFPVCQKRRWRPIFFQLECLVYSKEIVINLRVNIFNFLKRSIWDKMCITSSSMVVPCHKLGLSTSQIVNLLILRGKNLRWLAGCWLSPLLLSRLIFSQLWGWHQPPPFSPLPLTGWKVIWELINLEASQLLLNSRNN